MSIARVVREALLLVALAPFAYYVCAIIAAGRFFRAARLPQSTSSRDFEPPISILKPIRGLDREAFENFASFCRQEYPHFEILFCASDESDPSVPVIRQLMADFPDCAMRLLIGCEPLGASDKVNKLCRMAREARYNLLIVSDSDVRVDAGFLRAIAAHFRDPAVGGVTCLYRGITDGSFAADIAALGNSTDFAPGVLVARKKRGLDFMLGAVMATTKQQLAEIGGFESLVDCFSDDYELGNRIARGGHRVELSAFPVSIVYPHLTLRDAFRQQLRWNLSVRASRPLGHLGMIFTQGLAWTILGIALATSWPGVCGFAVAYSLLRTDAALTVGARGMNDPLVRRKQHLLVLRDAFAFAAWVASFFPRRIVWRGQPFYIRKKRLVVAGGTPEEKARGESSDARP